VARPPAKSLSKISAAVATIAFGLTFAGFLTLDVDGPTIVLAIVAPFVGVVAGVAAVVVAYRRREPAVWPWGSLVLNVVPAGFWALVIVVATSD
jgi:hypothetical protein